MAGTARTKTSSKRSAVEVIGERLDRLHFHSGKRRIRPCAKFGGSFARCLQVRIAREGVSIGMWFVLRMLVG